MTPEPNFNIPFKRQFSRQSSRQSGKRARKESEMQLDKNNDRASLIDKEEKEEGAVGCSTYRAYITGGGGVGAFFLVLLVSLLAEGCRAFSYWWLAEWIRDGSGVRQPHDLYIDSVDAAFSFLHYTNLYVMVQQSSLPSVAEHDHYRRKRDLYQS